jgi:nucleoside-triphosphatase
MKKRLFLITGSPGVGKTTVLMKTVDVLKAKGYFVGGMVSRDVRSAGSRIGFELTDLSSGRSGWLARVDQKQGPIVGKYRVNLEDLGGLGANAIMQAVEKSDVIVIDEIGPMELFSPQFKQSVTKTLQSIKPAVCTVHWNMKNQLVEETKRRVDAETFVVTYENRDHLHEQLAERIIGLLALKETNKEL